MASCGASVALSGPGKLPCRFGFAKWLETLVALCRGYATGTPGDRYRNKIFGSWVWYSLIGMLFTTGATAISISGLI